MSEYAHHDEHHEAGHFHNSWAPITMSMGLMVTIFGFAVWGWGAAIVGLTVFGIGLLLWWQQDMPLDGSYEPKAVHAPFHGQDVRKVGVWIFLMSEMMVFSSFFSTYIRYRATGRESFGATGTHGEATFAVASDFITHNFWTLLPGGINTLILIFSSFTVVMGLRWAKQQEFSMPLPVLGKLPRIGTAWTFLMGKRNMAVGTALLTTMICALLFIALKLYEWSILYNVDHFTHADGLAGATFYTTTGAHGVHVFGGVVALTYMTMKAYKGNYGPMNAQSIEYFGLYWHFVDLMWVIIFPGFYLY